MQVNTAIEKVNDEETQRRLEDLYKDIKTVSFNCNQKNQQQKAHNEIVIPSGLNGLIERGEKLMSR